MYRSHVLVCGGTGCSSSGSQRIRERLEKEIAAMPLPPSSWFRLAYCTLHSMS